MDFPHYRKKNKRKKPAQNSVKGKVKMGCTTSLHPWDIQVQILKIYAQNMWQIDMIEDKILTAFWSDPCNLIQYSIVPNPAGLGIESVTVLIIFCLAMYSQAL